MACQKCFWKLGVLAERGITKSNKHSIFVWNRSYPVMFFYFLIPLSAKTPSFESISGRPSSKKAIKNRCFRWEGYEKVEKHIAPEWGPSIFCCKNIYKMRDLEFIRGSPGSPGSRQFPGNDVASRCSEPPFPTHGGQDDGSYTNALKLNGPIP